MSPQVWKESSGIKGESIFTDSPSCWLRTLSDVEPDTNVDRLGGNSRYLGRVMGWRAHRQWYPVLPACYGTVRLLWLKE